MGVNLTSSLIHLFQLEPEQGKVGAKHYHQVQLIPLFSNDSLDTGCVRSTCGECLQWRSSVLAPILPLLCRDIRSCMGLLKEWVLGQRGSSKTSLWVVSDVDWGSSEGRKIWERSWPQNGWVVWAETAHCQTIRFLTGTLALCKKSCRMLYKDLIPRSLLTLQCEPKQCMIKQLASKWTVDPN